MRRTICLLFALTACSHASLEGGARVVVAQTLGSDPCVAVQSLQGLAYGSLVHGDSLDAYAVDDLRNQAADVGATNLIIEETLPSAHACVVRGTAYKCAPAAAATSPAKTAPESAPATPSAPVNVAPATAPASPGSAP